MHCCGSSASSAASSSSTLARLAFGHDAIGQPHRQRFGGIDRAAGQDHVHRATMPDDPRQAHRAAVDQRHPPPSAEDTHYRVLLDDPHIAPQRQLQTTRDRISADRGDHRLRQHHPARPHRAGPGAVHRVGIRRAERLEIGSGTECSVIAPQHGDGSRVVLVELVERRVQLGGRGPVDGVARLGPVHDHRRHRAAALDPHPAIVMSPPSVRTSSSPRDQFRGEVV